MKPLTTIDGLEDFMDKMVPLMRGNMERDGAVHPFVVIFGCRNPETGEVLSEPAPIFMALAALPMRDDHDKDMIRGVIDDAIRQFLGVGVAFVTEAWMIETLPNGYDYTKCRPSQHPDRVEIVNVTCEHKTGGSLIYKIPILRTGDQATLGEPEKLRTPRPSALGRFGNFFKTAKPEIHA